MKIIIRATVLIILLLSMVFASGYFFWYKPKFKPSSGNRLIYAERPRLNELTNLRIKERSSEIKTFLKSTNYNSNICFLIDMKINSGKNRFFVFNLKNNVVDLAGLVAHGSGTQNTSKIMFSNVPGSNCSSLGRYKVGKPYNGKFGLAYKLYGLDKTNSNALNRFVVLHSHACVPVDEVYPINICESWGCPTVAPAFLSALKKYIDQSEKPILMSIYY